MDNHGYPSSDKVSTRLLSRQPWHALCLFRHLHITRYRLGSQYVKVRILAKKTARRRLLFPLGCEQFGGGIQAFCSLSSLVSTKPIVEFFTSNLSVLIEETLPPYGRTTPA
jgi:hypothetical protein